MAKLLSGAATPTGAASPWHNSAVASKGACKGRPDVGGIGCETDFLRLWAGMHSPPLWRVLLFLGSLSHIAGSAAGRGSLPHMCRWGKGLIIRCSGAETPSSQGGEEPRRWFSTYCLSTESGAPPAEAAK